MRFADLAGVWTRPPTVAEHFERQNTIARTVNVIVDDSDEPFPELHHRTDAISEAVERLLALHKGG